jgi:hypothetical protein
MRYGKADEDLSDVVFNEPSRLIVSLGIAVSSAGPARTFVWALLSLSSGNPSFFDARSFAASNAFCFASFWFAASSIARTTPVKTFTRSH